MGTAWFDSFGQVFFYESGQFFVTLFCKGFQDEFVQLLVAFVCHSFRPVSHCFKSIYL